MVLVTVSAIRPRRKSGGGEDRVSRTRLRPMSGRRSRIRLLRRFRYPTIGECDYFLAGSDPAKASARVDPAVERRVVGDHVGRQRRVALHRPAGHRRERPGTRQRDERLEVRRAEADHPGVGEQPGREVAAGEQRRVPEHLPALRLRVARGGRVEPGDELRRRLREGRRGHGSPALQSMPGWIAPVGTHQDVLVAQPVARPAGGSTAPTTGDGRTAGRRPRRRRPCPASGSGPRSSTPYGYSGSRM